MTVVTRQHTTARLLGVFALSLAAFGLVASAAGAALYVIDSERGFGTDEGTATANVDLPSGMVLVTRLADAAAWEPKLGFEPVLPDELPAGVGTQPHYYAQQPDERGRLAGHIRYASEGGPSVVLVEQQGTLSREVGMRTQELDGVRQHVESFGCGLVVIQAQLYVSTDAPGAPTAEDSGAMAAAFVASLRRQCGS